MTTKTTKYSKTTFTKTSQKRAVNRTFSLVRNGTSITNARKTVANELHISPNTLWVWQQKFDMTTPSPLKNSQIIRSNGVKHQPITKTGSNVIKGLENMKGKLGVVFTSLVDQDGRFSNQDATAIAGTANVILGCCKQVLLERTAITKVNKTKHLSNSSFV